jgi:hypothetical protein
VKIKHIFGALKYQIYYVSKFGNLMKKVFPATFVLILMSLSLRSQTIQNTGRPLVEIYTDFHYSMKPDVKTTGYSVNKAYFGYNFIADENFSATIKLNLGNTDDVLTATEPRRYSYFREVSISYKKDQLNLTMGMTSTMLYNFQQRFWGKRYIANTFQSLNSYGAVADLGLVADYKFSDIIDVDLTLMNGEGYNKIQLDNSLRASLGITVTPIIELAFRLYGDMMKIQNLWQKTLVGFAGFKNDKVTIGGEISYKSNLDLVEGHHAWGFSGTGAVNLTKKIEFFTRYDYSTSIIVPGDETQWNHAKDGRFLINGFQYTLNNLIKIALDNQATFPADRTRPISDLIFINVLFKF